MNKLIAYNYLLTDEYLAKRDKELTLIFEEHGFLYEPSFVMEDADHKFGFLLAELYEINYLRKIKDGNHNEKEVFNERIKKEVEEGFAFVLLGSFFLNDKDAFLEKNKGEDISFRHSDLGTFFALEDIPKFVLREMNYCFQRGELKYSERNPYFFMTRNGGAQDKGFLRMQEKLINDLPDNQKLMCAFDLEQKRKILSPYVTQTIKSTNFRIKNSYTVSSLRREIRAYLKKELLEMIENYQEKIS